MCERSGDGDASPDLHPARMSRRSGVTLPQPAPDTSPRRSSIIKDPAVHKVGGGRKKTVSFSSMPSEKKVSSVTDCLAFMQCGCELKKVRPNSRVYCRFYTLDPDLSCLRWEPSKKDSDRARLDIVTMREVCTGKSTDTFRHHGSVEHLAEEAAFSIVHGEGYQTLDLVALSPDVANIWVTGLRYLISHPSHCSGAPKGSLGSRLRRDWLAAQFAESDEGGCGVMPEDVAVATICKLCPGIKESKVRLRFKEIQRSKEKLTSHVTLEEFQEAYCELCTRPDVYFLLVQLTQDRECLDAQDLRVFLETEQGLPQVSSESCLHIVHRFEPSLQGRNQGLLGLDGFMRYLQSPECQLSEPEQQNVCQDMNLPLCHYYISTSYRSYLVEDQVLGQADFGGLLRAMQAGCRCLELGVTDGPENEPVLGVGFSPGAGNSHRTSTKPITARGALEVINKYAFLTSQYPLLLYLCQHCSPCQQQVLAQHLSRVFGDRLYIPNASDSVTLPSPEQLKGRILLVGKRLPPQVDVSEGEVSEEEEEGALGLMKRQGSSPEAELLVEGSPVKPCRLRLRKELSELLVLSHSGSHAFHSCHHSPEHSPSSTLDPQGTALWTLCSLSETEAARLASESPEELVGFTKGTLTRVRPSAARLDSSNPNPLDFWKGGCQLVALNQQTPGVMLDLYRARFSQNGGCGYVLKPSLMREEVSYFSAQTQGCVPGVPPQTLRVKVISANGLPKPQGSGAKGEVIDPYVVLELHGVPADCTEFRTRTAAQNQDNPLFDETFEFQVNMPELAILRFVVLDDDYIGDDFIGQYSIPFECLQPGYRTVPLLDLLGEPLPHGSLFIHLAVTNRSGGGKAHKRGLSVRRGARQEQDSVTLRSINIKALDDSFRAANAPLKEATDLRVNAQNATVSFKEHCGLPSVATLKQCVQSLATRLQTPDGPSGVGLVLREGYPCLEGLGNLSEATRRVLSAFDAMISAQRQLIENADAYMERITQVQKEGMEYHEDLRRFGEKEGLKGRKHSKAVESFAWNITVLKGQRDLLRSAKADALDVLRQLTLSAEVCGLTTDNTKTD